MVSLGFPPPHSLFLHERTGRPVLAGPTRRELNIDPRGFSPRRASSDFRVIVVVGTVGLFFTSGFSTGCYASQRNSTYLWRHSSRLLPAIFCARPVLGTNASEYGSRFWSASKQAGSLPTPGVGDAGGRAARCAANEASCAAAACASAPAAPGRHAARTRSPRAKAAPGSGASDAAAARPCGGRRRSFVN